MPIPVAVAIGAGVSALLPLVTEMLREKPDPEAAKMLVQSKRQELIDQKIGGGLTRANAEKAVDEELGKAMAEADRQGQFNTPVGEMVAGAILGGVGGWAGGKLLSKFAPNVAKKFGMGAADEAASKVSGGSDVYRSGFRSPRTEARMQGADDVVSPVRSGGNLGYNNTERGFTMSPGDSPFPSKGRGDFNVEVIGSTGGARMPRVEVSGPMPSMAAGGERLTAPAMAGRIGYNDPMAGGVMGEIVGTPATMSPFPASVTRRMGRASGVRSQQSAEAFARRRDIEEQIRQQQIDRAFEQQQLLGGLGLGG